MLFLRQTAPRQAGNAEGNTNRGETENIMKLSELIRQLNLTLLTSKDYADREIGGCYIGDLLSWVMGRAQQGDVWITIMNNINIVAVASLTGCACILLCEDVTAGDDIIAKADEEGIVILKSGETAYGLAARISGVI